MARPKVLAMILAGGEGSRLDVLTEQRAKPAMPYAGVYRLIDFSLSNCVHSRLSDVWVIEQYEPHSLNEHLANGRPWDLDRTYGGLQVLPPYVARDDSDDNDEDDEDDGRNGGGFAQGNADAIYRHRSFIRDFEPDVLLVLSADHVYKLDYQDVINRHLEQNAAVTIVTTEVPIEKAARFGTIKVGKEDRVTDFAYKPEQPESNLVTTEVFVYHAPTLLETLDQIAAKNTKDKAKNKKRGKDESGAVLKDFGHELLPALVKQGRAYEHRFTGYWRDLGTIESYFESHMDLLADAPPLVLDDPAWPLLTYRPPLLPARIYGSAHIDNSMISPGCIVRGQVNRSILAPGVVVEEGAVVENSILLHGTTVKADARVSHAILDEKVVIESRAKVGESPQQAGKDAAAARREVTAEEITLIGCKARIASGKNVQSGARIKPNEAVG